ncbi:MAG: Rpn family recombination-promoting nuclease/putative transposase [Tannerella sp.]|jgi:predicted transposase/invertase (TIGR01784 family)|nr:Rpn family recombination-promoting nuclease/putative transposase [Tannerella sp.]
MVRYLDPRSDLVFKRVFGEHPDLAMSFLNAMMPFGRDQYIEHLEYLPSEQVPDNPTLKNSIVDVRCMDNRGRRFIIEMQIIWEQEFLSRMLFNTSKSYVRQIKKATDYTMLKPVYGLAIVNDVYDKKTAEFYHRYQIVNVKNPEETIDDMEFIFVELPKFVPETLADRKMAALWIQFLRETGESNEVPAELESSKEIGKALEICMESAFTEEELAVYEGFLDAVRVKNTIIRASEARGEARGLEIGEARGEARGEAIGEARGEARGLEKGLEKGRNEGRDERNTEIVLNLHAMDMTVEQIHRATALSLDQIKKIINR